MRRWLGGAIVLVLIWGPARAAEPQPKVLRETWYVSRTDAGKLGHLHLKAREVERDGRKLIHTTSREEISYLRSGDPYHETLEQESFETATGEVVELSYLSTLAKNQKLRIRGRVEGEQLTLEVLGEDGKPTKYRRTIPWNPKALGLYAQDRFLESKPLKAGDRYTLHSFHLTMNRVVPTIYTVKDVEAVRVNGEKRVLPRIEQSYSNELYLSTSTHWVNKDGMIVKTEQDMPLFGSSMTYEVSDEVTAGGRFRPRVADVEAPILINQPVSFKRGAPRELVLRVSMEGEHQPGTLFVQDGRQQVVKADRRAVELRLLAKAVPEKAGWAELEANLILPFASMTMMPAAGLSAALPGYGTPLPSLATGEFLDSNLFICSDHELVRKLARQAVGEEADPHKQLTLLRKWFRFKFKPGFDVAFATADEVARTLEGDCSEMGILAAAMCRSLGMPSRAAFGLVYDQANPGFGGHLWTEVYINGRWEPFDPTGVLDTLGAAYIKIAAYSLKDAFNPDELLEVRRAFAGRMKVEVVEDK